MNADKLLAFENSFNANAAGTPNTKREALGEIFGPDLADKISGLTSNPDAKLVWNVTTRLRTVSDQYGRPAHLPMLMFYAWLPSGDEGGALLDAKGVVDKMDLGQAARDMRTLGISVVVKVGVTDWTKRVYEGVKDQGLKYRIDRFGDTVYVLLRGDPEESRFPEFDATNLIEISMKHSGLLETGKPRIPFTTYEGIGRFPKQLDGISGITLEPGKVNDFAQLLHKFESDKTKTAGVAREIHERQKAAMEDRQEGGGRSGVRWGLAAGAAAVVAASLLQA